jgi:hypothetical protein
MMAERSPIAGWYRDPLGGPGHRWWDGSAWTGHFLADEVAAPPSAHPPPAPADDAEEVSRLQRMGLLLLALEVLVPLVGIAVVAAGGALVLKRRLAWGSSLIAIAIAVFALRLALFDSVI